MVAQEKNCIECNELFQIRAEDLHFYDRISPEFGGKKYSIPPPTRCPSCRWQRRLSFRNERTLYRRKCDLSGKSIISMYPEDVPPVRHKDRVALRNPRKLWKRTWAKTNENILSTIAPERPEIVYSEKAYLEEIL